MQYLLLHFLLHFESDFLSVFDAHLDNFESVPYEVVLHFGIDAVVALERRSVVNLKHPWFQLLVQHHVKAEQLEAALRLLGLTAPIDVL